MRRYSYLILAIILNAMGHSLTIVTNVGSMPWPASIVNIMHTLGWTMTETIFTEGMVVIILNIILSGRWQLSRFTRELTFLIPYSILMQLFADAYRIVGIDHLNFWWRLGLDMVGLTIAFLGFSLYQTCDCCFHPHDDLTIILKRRVNAQFVQWFNILLPVIIIAGCTLYNHQIYAIHVGTLFGLLLRSRITGFFDRHVSCHCNM